MQGFLKGKASTVVHASRADIAVAVIADAAAILGPLRILGNWIAAKDLTTAMLAPEKVGSDSAAVARRLEMAPTPAPER